jgi:hypothetical protein
MIAFATSTKDPPGSVILCFTGVKSVRKHGVVVSCLAQ